MADSRAVDAAQNAGFTVASTTGIVTGPLSSGALHRLQRVVEAAEGKVEYGAAAEAAVLDAFATTAGKGIRFTAATPGVAGNDLTIEIAVPADDNQAHAIASTDVAGAVVVTLAVDTDGSTVLSTAADVVAEVEANVTSVTAELLDVAATQETLAQAVFEDIGSSAGDNLIFTGKAGADLFEVTIRPPRSSGPEAAYTSVTVRLLDRNHIDIVVPATKTVANVKTAVEAHTAANALVTVTTAGTTTHAITFDADGHKVNQLSSFANRGSALMTVLAEDSPAGGADADSDLRVVPAVA